MVLDSIWRIRSQGSRRRPPVFVEGLGLAVGHAEAHCDHAGFTLGEGVEYGVELFLRRVKDTASAGTTASESSMRSPGSGVAVFTEGCAGRWVRGRISRTSMTFSGVISSSLPRFFGVGSRPRSWSIWRCTQASLLMTSTMCTGMRMVRAWSAIARVMAWRIHQVA